MKYQFMPLFWGDFLANTMHLTAQEAGAYLFLIAHAWEHDGKIAARDFQRISRVRHDHWPKVFERLKPFFEWEKDPNSGALSWGTHHRVQAELLKAGEISNKRKDAALQKHSKSKANGHANDPHLHLQLPNKDAALGKGSKEPDRQTVPAEPKPVAEGKQGMSPDLGNDYRSPPGAKSDHVLTPLPDKQPPRQPAQMQAGDKKPAENSRQELEAIYAAAGFKRPGSGPTS